MLMESILVHFTLFGLLCIMKFRKVMDNPSSMSWWIWLILGSASLTCALWYIGKIELIIQMFQMLIIH